jgi:LPS sulfotransferase NodH
VQELLKVVVVTRGRTGSTVITEELGRAPGCRAEQEAFSQGADVVFYDLPPFEAWRRGRPPADEALEAEAYLDILEGDTRARGCRALFWKVLSQHLDERPYLGDMLRRRDYRVVYLRRAPVHQSLSGIIAQARGLYHSRSVIEDERTFMVDAEHLRRVAEFERFAAARDEARLFKHRFPTILANYEDFLADRVGFFDRIYASLGLPPALPPASDYVLTLPDPKAVIANFDEVSAVAAEFGERL